jgi:hypothetical protein
MTVFMRNFLSNIYGIRYIAYAYPTSGISKCNPYKNGKLAHATDRLRNNSNCYKSESCPKHVGA